MHILERHDAYFMVLSERQPMYRCIVEECQQTFQVISMHRCQVPRLASCDQECWYFSCLPLSADGKGQALASDR
jgi:hypothetical protein